MSEKTIAPAVPSATILLLREDEQDGLEVFMVVRHHQIDFASGALVFPGGKADEQDFDDALIPYLAGASEAPAMRAIEVSAIREVFEECGILLAYTEAGSLIDGARLAELQHCREALNDGSLTLKSFVESERLRLACDQLVHFAHWITPEMMPKRFDTHFYLATAPDDQLAVHDGYESVDSVWIIPAQAMADAAAGTRTVIFPTLRNIEKLGTFATVAQAMAAARDATAVPVLPWTEQREDGNYVCISPDAGYVVCEEKIPARSA